MPVCCVVSGWAVCVCVWVLGVGSVVVLFCLPGCRLQGVGLRRVCGFLVGSFADDDEKLGLVEGFVCAVSSHPERLPSVRGAGCLVICLGFCW